MQSLLQQVTTIVCTAADANSKTVAAAEAACRRNVEIINQRERFLGVAIDHLRSPILQASLTLDAFLSGGCGRLDPHQQNILSELKSNHDSLLMMLNSLEESFSIDSYGAVTFVELDN